MRVNNNRSKNSNYSNEVLIKDTKSPNNICTKSLIAILSMQSIYNEVYKLMESNLHFIQYMSVEDRQALNNKSNIKLDEIIKNIKNWTYSCEPLYIKKSNERMFTHITKLKSLPIPSLKDIILQTAIKLLIESECEKKIFNIQSGPRGTSEPAPRFGFRPNRSVHHALNSVKKMVGVT
jgi:hypothetical protein